MSDNTSVGQALLGFVPGAVGGFCNVIVGHPIDLVKVRMQTQSTVSDTIVRASTTTSGGRGVGGGAAVLLAAHASPATAAAAESSSTTMGMMRSVLVKDGIVGMYAGVSAPLLAVVPAFALVFWSYDWGKSMQRRYNRTDEELSSKQYALAGAFTGIPLGMVLGPLERIKCLMQLDKSRYNGLQDCARQVYRDGGMRSVFRGTGLTVLRDVPGNAAYFGTYEFTRRNLAQWEGRRDPSLVSTFLAGGFAGVANWIVAIPVDVVKSRWQTAAAGTYNSPVHVLRVLLEREGPAALVRGISPALMRAFPSNAACLLGVETSRRCLAYVS